MWRHLDAEGWSGVHHTDGYLVDAMRVVPVLFPAVRSSHEAGFIRTALSREGEGCSGADALRFG